jgi:hypothetical protein
MEWYEGVGRAPGLAKILGSDLSTGLSLDAE